MKALVIGAAGKMGRAVVSYLTNESDVTQVGLLDVSDSALTTLARQTQPDKCTIHPLDVQNLRMVKATMESYDVGVVTLPNRKLSYKVMEAAIDSGLNLVDILEEYHRRPDCYETEGLEIPSAYMSAEAYGEALHDKAVKKGVLILDGMGFAPGLSNITTAKGIASLDHTKTVVARVGGIPNKESAKKHPLRYVTTWSLEHVLREYFVKTRMIKDGSIIEIQALSEPESFTFQEFGISEEFECAITPGMPSFIYTNPGLDYFAEKTIRWPGHYQGVMTLIECGLFRTEANEINGHRISPREFLLHLLNPLLLPQAGDQDVCIMYNTVIGDRNGKSHKVEYYMWVEAADGFSAMARVTGYSAAIGAKLIALGKFSTTGICAPEECVTGESYELFIEELGKCGISIIEKVCYSN